MRSSAMQSYFKTTNLLCEWHAGFCGGYFSPSACKKQKSLVHPLSPCFLVYLSYTKTPNCLCVVLILDLVWMCAGFGASSCPPYKCLRTFLHKSLFYLPQLCEETNALLVDITQTFSRGGDGTCTRCNKAEGDHFNHPNGYKYCYVSTTSPCPPPHVYVFCLAQLRQTACVLC